jgi:hypothetical protein
MPADIAFVCGVILAIVIYEYTLKDFILCLKN